MCHSRLLCQLRNDSEGPFWQAKDWDKVFRGVLDVPLCGDGSVGKPIGLTTSCTGMYIQNALIRLEHKQRMGVDPTSQLVTVLGNDDTQSPKQDEEMEDATWSGVSINWSSILYISKKGTPPLEPGSNKSTDNTAGAMAPVPLTDTEDELEAIVESRMAANKNSGQFPPPRICPWWKEIRSKRKCCRRW